MKALRNRPARGNSWCGPTAIAHLTDGDYARAQADADARAGKPIRGMALREVREVLEARGLRLRRMPDRERRIARRRIWHYLGPYTALIVVRGHYLTADGWIMADQAATCWWADHYYARHAVRYAYRVVPA